VSTATSEVSARASSASRTIWIYFAVLVVLALFTRLYQLDTLPYGHNNDSTRMTLDGFVLLQDGKYEPLTYQARESTLPYLYGLLVDLFGFSNGIIRLPSALVGVVGVLCLCLLIFRIMPNLWAFCVSLTLVTYGPLLALDRLALRASVCSAVIFIFLLLFFALRESDRRSHWFLLGLVFGVGFHSYGAYRAMPLYVAILLAIHFWQAEQRAHLWRKLLFFGLGALLGGINMVYTFLTEPPSHYLWREGDLFGKVVASDAGLIGMVSHNLVEFFLLMLGRDFPLPVGAEVPYFHAAWLPLLAFGIYVAARARARSVEFAILIGLGVFLAPGLLTDELFARRILTALVLVVALTGIGAYEAIRRLGEERNRRIRTLVLLLAVGVAACNLWSYFVAYASMPKWKQGPFFASQRWYGPMLRDHVGPETKIIFASDIEDIWTMTLYLTDILDVRLHNPAFLYLPSHFDEGVVEQIEGFCADSAPMVFLFRVETPSEIHAGVIERCRMTEVVPLPVADGIVKKVQRRIIMAKREHDTVEEP
jgi:hypothetical protein